MWSGNQERVVFLVDASQEVQVSDARVQADLKPDEVKVIQKMRETVEPDVDFLIFRRDGRIVNIKRTINDQKEFTNHALAQPVQ